MSRRNERSNAKCEPGNIFAVSGDRNPMPNVTAGFRAHWAVDNATANAIVAFLAHSGGTGSRNAVEMRKSHSRTRLSRGNAAVSAHIEAVELEGTGSPMSSQPSPTSGEAYCRSASPMTGSAGIQPPPSDGLRRRHVQCAHRVKSCTAAHFVGYARRRRGICAPNAPRLAPAAPTARSLFGATPIYRP